MVWDQTFTSLTISDLMIPESSEGLTCRERQELASTFDKVWKLTVEEVQGLMTEAKVALTILDRLERTHKVLNQMRLGETRIVNRDSDDFVSVFVHLF